MERIVIDFIISQTDFIEITSVLNMIKKKRDDVLYKNQLRGICMLQYRGTLRKTRAALLLLPLFFSRLSAWSWYR